MAREYPFRLQLTNYSVFEYCKCFGLLQLLPSTNCRVCCTYWHLQIAGQVVVAAIYKVTKHLQLPTSTKLLSVLHLLETCLVQQLDLVPLIVFLGRISRNLGWGVVDRDTCVEHWTAGILFDQPWCCGRSMRSGIMPWSKRRVNDYMWGPRSLTAWWLGVLCGTEFCLAGTKSCNIASMRGEARCSLTSSTKPLTYSLVTRCLC